MKLEEFTKKNREILLFFAAAAVLLSILGYLYFKEDWSGSEGSYPANLSTTQEIDHNWQNVSTIGDVDNITVKELGVYDAKGLDIDGVRDLVRELEFVMSSESVTDDERFYSWSRQRDTAQYDSLGRSITVSTSGVKLEKLESRALDQESVLEYFSEFMSEYIGIDQEYSVRAERKGDVYQVSGTWLIGGHPVVCAYNEEDLISVRFGALGTLESISMYLVEFEETDGIVQLVSVPDALSYVRAQAYPKEIFLEAMPGSEQECSSEGCLEYDLTGLDGFTSLTIDTSQIVYLFSQYASTDVLPVYQFRGDAVVPYEGSGIETMNATLYVNAIDPAQVTIPTAE